MIYISQSILMHVELVEDHHICTHQVLWYHVSKSADTILNNCYLWKLYCDVHQCKLLFLFSLIGIWAAACKHAHTKWTSGWELPQVKVTSRAFKTPYKSSNCKDSSVSYYKLYQEVQVKGDIFSNLTHCVACEKDGIRHAHVSCYLNGLNQLLAYVIEKGI